MMKPDSLPAVLTKRADPNEAPPDDLDDILDLMDRVKTKRERLKRIGRRAKKTNRSPSSSPPSFKEQLRRHEALGGSPSVSPKGSRTPASLVDTASSQRTPIRQMLKELWPPLSKRDDESTSDRPSSDDENDEERMMEEGEFVDEPLGDNDVVAKPPPTMQGDGERKRVFANRILSAFVFIVTLILVLVFVIKTIQPKSEEKRMHPNLEKEVPEDDDDNDVLSPTLCFQTKEELETAVEEYVRDPPTQHSTISRKYGYPMHVWCVGNVTDFAHLFAGRNKDYRYLYSEFNEPLHGWDMSSATTVEGMFDGCAAFNQDISMWNLGNVHDFREFLRNAESFDQDLSNWDMRSARRIESMFEGAKSFRGIGLEHWSLPNVETLDRMFQGCSVFNGDVSGWDVSGVISMMDTFRDCALFNQDLHQWRFSPDFYRFPALFQGCTSFNGRVDGWNIGETKVSSLERVFFGASSFNKPLDSWDVSKVERFDKTFSGATTFNQDLSSWKTRYAHVFDEMFHDAASFNHDISHWDMSHAESLQQMFRGATSFDQPVGKWELEKVKDMSFMFADAISFNQDLSGWNVTTVEKMTGMFENSPKFNSDIGSWSMSQVQNIDLMFRDAFAFNQDISQWNLTNVRQMGGVLDGAMAFNQDLCDWRLTLILRSPTNEAVTADVATDVLFGSSVGVVPLEDKLFGGSGCDEQSTPLYHQNEFVGPFCHECSTR